MKSYYIKNGDLYAAEPTKVTEESDFWEVSEITAMSYVQYNWVKDKKDAMTFFSYNQATDFLGSRYKIKEFRNAQIVRE